MVTTLEHEGKARSRSARLGLDIGASGVRVVELTGKADGYVVTRAACYDRPRTTGDETVQDASSLVDSNDPRLLARQIETCFRRTGFRGKSVAVALAPPDVEFHTLELPAAALRAGEHDVDQIVRIEVGRLMTCGQSDVETRYWRLPETTLPAPNTIAAGASQGVITRTIEACARAGMTCMAVDTTATALGRFGAVLQRRPQDQVWGVLDLGERQSRLVLCLQGRGDQGESAAPVLVRTVGAGGRAWTRCIADALQVSFKAAEIHKRDHGIALTGRALVRESILAPAAGDGTRSELASLILGAVRADLNDLAAEVKRSYEYVLSCYSGSRAADLALCGAGALLPNLSEFLGSALGIPVRRASNYLEGETCRLSLRAVHERNAPLEVLAVAVGLAIAE